MLRKTVAKAFGESTLDRPSPVAPAAHQTRRENAVERLFQDLLEAFEQAVERGDAVRAGGESADSGVFGLTPGLVFHQPRPRAGGVELAIEGPGGALTVLNTLAGRILVFAGSSAEGGELVETLSVDRYAGEYRPIRRPVAVVGDDHIRRRAAAGYRFTSAAELSRGYLEQITTVHKIDTRRVGP